MKTIFKSEISLKKLFLKGNYNSVEEFLNRIGKPPKDLNLLSRLINVYHSYTHLIFLYLLVQYSVMQQFKFERKR